MSKPLVYLVRTNYDWDGKSSEEATEFLRDNGLEALNEVIDKDPERFKRDELFHPDFRIFANYMNLCEKLQEYDVDVDKEPHIEFNYNCIVTRTSPGGIESFDPPESIQDYETLRDIILLQHDQIPGTMMTNKMRRMNPDITHIRLLFDYVSNAGKYDALFDRLSEDFEVVELKVYDPVWNKALEEVSSE